ASRPKSRRPSESQAGTARQASRPQHGRRIPRAPARGREEGGSHPQGFGHRNRRTVPPLWFSGGRRNCRIHGTEIQRWTLKLDTNVVSELMRREANPSI